MFCSNVYSTSASRAEHWQFVTGLKRTVDAIASDKEELGGHVTVTHALLRRLKKMGKFARVYTQNVSVYGEKGPIAERDLC